MIASSDPGYLELVSWAITIGVPALAGLAGVCIGSVLTARREQKQRRLSFVEKQLQDFYSVLVGVRTDIRMRSEVRAKVQSTASTVWKRLCNEATDQGGSDFLRRLTESRWPVFQRVIEFDNRALEDELLPLYREMVERFRTHYWLAEPDTREYFPELVEFVELWNRAVEDSVPGEVVVELEHSEKRLYPFFNHLTQKHDELREMVRLARV